jgi:hypothetical protein
MLDSTQVPHPESVWGLVKGKDYVKGMFENLGKARKDLHQVFHT